MVSDNLIASLRNYLVKSRHHMRVPAAADIKKYGDKDYEMVGGEADVPVRSPDQGSDTRCIVLGITPHFDLNSLSCIHRCCVVSPSPEFAGPNFLKLLHSTPQSLSNNHLS